MNLIAQTEIKYSPDGFSVKTIAKGEIFTASDEVAAGWLARGEAKHAVMRAVVAADEDETGADDDPGKEGEGSKAGEGDEIAIPDGWRDLQHLSLIHLGKKVDAAVKTKADAIAAIEAYLAKKAAA